MADKDYKQISSDAAKIIRGLLTSIQTKKGGHYSCINAEYIDFSKSEEQPYVGNFLYDAYQWLFDNCGIYWKKYLDFLTPEQREKVEKTFEKKDSTNGR